MSRRLVVCATAAALTLTVVPAYAAVQSGAPTGPAAAPAATPTRITSSSALPGGSATSSSPTSSPAPQPYSPPAPPSGAVSGTSAVTITPQSRFALKVDPKTHQLASGSWPDAGSLFTVQELAQVVPGLTAVTVQDCAPDTVDGGGTAATRTRCTLALTIKGEPAAIRSKLIISIRGFGEPKPVGEQWTRTLTAQRERASKRPGLETFFTNGSLGASAAYTDGTTTRVLLQRGDVAGDIWFSGIGFTRLKGDYLASRKDYRDRVLPALVQLLATKMRPAGS